MPRVTNCLHSFKEANPEVAAYLAKKSGVDFDGTNGKEQYLAAIKALQQHSLDTINDIYADLGIEGYKRVKLGEKQISEAADAAGQTLTPIQQRMNNADYIDQGELNQTADQLYDLMDKIDNSSLTAEQKKSAFNLIEPLINQLESYELATTTKVSTITEKAPTGRTNKTKIETKPILEQSEGSNVQIKDEEGNTVRGKLNVRGNTYVVDVPGARQRVLGEKRMTDRTLSLPNETEMAHPVTLDKDGNVESVTVKIHSGHLITIEDPEKALDIAIQLQAQQLGEVPDGAFNEIYEDVEREVKETVLVNEGKAVKAEQKAAAAKQDVVPSADIEKQKADIEKRRQTDVAAIWEKTDVKIAKLKAEQERGFANLQGQNKTVVDRAEKLEKAYEDLLEKYNSEINIKYDAELAALEKSQPKQQTTAAPAAQPKQDVVPSGSEFEDFTAEKGNKLVDESGKPMVLYHGSPHDYSDIKLGGDNYYTGGGLIFLSPSKEYSEGYGKVKQYHAIAKNPFDITKNEHREILAEYNRTREHKYEQVAVGDSIDWKGLPFLNEYLKEKGFDAILHIWEGVGKPESIAINSETNIKEINPQSKQQTTPTTEQKLAANKKISELVPGLGGEKELENEIKAQAQPTPAAQPEPAQQKPVVNKENFKKIADTIRKGKIDKDINMAGIPFFKQVWNGAVEITAQAVERTGDLAAAVEEGVRYIQNSAWYKGLTSDQQKRAEQRFRDEFKEEQNLSGIRMSLMSDEIIRRADVERIGDHEMMDLGRKILATGEVKPEALVQQILEEKTGVLKPAEVVAMITYKADLDTLLRDAYRELNEKQAAGQPTGGIRGEIRDMERKQSEFEIAAVITAATQSMAFRLRQYMLNQDYNVTKRIEKYKSDNNGYIPPHIEEKFRDLDRQLRDIKDKYAIVERQLYDQLGQRDINDIKEDIERKEGAALFTQQELEEKVKAGVQKTIDEIYSKLPKEKKSIADKAIKALENFQKNLRGKNYSDATGIVAIVDSGITLIKNAIKAGVAVAEAVEIGIKGIRDAMNKAGLTQFKEDEFRKDALAAFNAAGVKTDRAKQDQPVINIDGTLTVPDEMLRQLVAQGLNNIDQITDAVHDRIKGELPDATKRQVRDFITDYAKRVNPTRDDLQLQVNAAKRVGRLLSELEDLQKGIRKQSNPSTRAKMTEDERILKQKIKAVEKSVPKTPSEKARESTDSIERAKERLRTKIAELKTRIANGDFTKKEKKTLPAEAELRQLQAQREQLQEQFDNEQYKNELKKRTGWKKLEDIALEATNGLVRALVASIDVSAVLVQGLFRLGSNPELSRRAFVTSMQHLVSEKASEQFLAEIKQREMYPLMQAAKLALDDKSGHVSVKEGLFISNWVNWLWDNVVSNILGAYYGREFIKKLNPYAASSRAFNGYINAIRANVFEQEAAELMKGKDAKNPEADMKDFEALADFINTTTGRGSIGALETNSRWLNTLLFAPRKVAAELKLFTPYAIIYYAKMPSSIRNKALLSLGKFLGSFATVNALIAAGKAIYNPDDFKEDYKNFWNMKSPDFLTHHFGDKRLSLAGGAKSLLTFQARFATGEFTDQYGVTTKLGERRGKKIDTKWDLMLSYALGKAAPAIALGAKLLDQRKGEELDKGELVEDVTVPMWMQDVDKLYNDAPLAASAILMVTSILGANVRTVDPKDFKPTVSLYYTDKQGNHKKRFASEKETAIYNKTKSEIAAEKTQFHKQEGVWIDAYGEVTLSEDRAEETIPFNKLTADQLKAFQSSVNRSAGTAAKKQLGWNKKTSDEEE